MRYKVTEFSLAKFNTREGRNEAWADGVEAEEDKLVSPFVALPPRTSLPVCIAKRNANSVLRFRVFYFLLFQGKSAVK